MKTIAFALALIISLSFASAKPPKNFRTENLVAWCIVPYDAKNSDPEARSKMLVELGITKCAYDWRKEHIPTFEEEIIQYKKHGIEYLAFWRKHDRAFELFEEHEIRPQIWETIHGPQDIAELSHKELVDFAVAEILPLAKQTQAMGSKLGLYNHGGWGGEPRNMVAVAKALRTKLGSDHIGIVYNFHHVHESIVEFDGLMQSMLPYLICLNLNGVTDAEAVRENPDKNKILPIGSGKFEKSMIQSVLNSGYDGPIGILGHIAHQDAMISLQENINGLQQLLEELESENAHCQERDSRPTKIRPADYLGRSKLIWKPKISLHLSIDVIENLSRLALVANKTNAYPKFSKRLKAF